MRDINELNEHTLKYFKQVTAKDANTLSEEEIGFIRAREMYLSTDLRNKFDSLFVKEAKK